MNTDSDSSTMATKEESTKSQATVKLSDTKHISITQYKEMSFFHIWDMKKVKSISLNAKELEKIIHKGPKMIKFGEDLIKKELKTKKSARKIRKDVVKQDIDMDSESDSESDTLE